MINDDQTMLPLEVVAAVIRDTQGRVLIAKRPSNKHQGGKWEFPGGKVEQGESRRSALTREIREEIGIEVGHCSRLISIYHEYSDKAIYLDIYEVTAWEGTPEGKEGQEITWVTAEALDNYQFPDANLPTIEAVRLPKQLKRIEQINCAEDFRHQVKSAIDNSYRMLFFSFDTAKNSFEPDVELINWMLDTAASQGARVLFESPPPLVRSDYNLCLNSDDLQKAQEKPSAERVAGVCHNAESLFKAQRLGLDFLIIDSVLVNQDGSSKGIGWPAFQSLSSRVNVPVYASGGMGEKELELAREYGAQGILL